MKEKLTLCSIGFAFYGLNIYALHINQPLFGILFGVTGAIMFVRALRIKP